MAITKPKSITETAASIMNAPFEAEETKFTKETKETKKTKITKETKESKKVTFTCSLELWQKVLDLAYTERSLVSPMIEKMLNHYFETTDVELMQRPNGFRTRG